MAKPILVVLHSGRGKKVGYTMLALYNRSNPYDVDKDEFTEVPKSNEFTLHPKLFIYPNETTTITIGNSLTMAERTGGDIQVIKEKADAHINILKRIKHSEISALLNLIKNSGEKRRFVAKQSFSVFDRTINIPGYTFAGVDYIAYTDISYVTNANKHALC